MRRVPGYGGKLRWENRANDGVSFGAAWKISAQLSVRPFTSAERSSYYLAVDPSSDRHTREMAPIVPRAYETTFHNSGVCLIIRMIRRRTLERTRAGRPRHVVVVV
jgi:hypothetical protein